MAIDPTRRRKNRVIYYLHPGEGLRKVVFSGNAVRFRTKLGGSMFDRPELRDGHWNLIPAKRGYRSAQNALALTKRGTIRAC